MNVLARGLGIGCFGLVLGQGVIAPSQAERPLERRIAFYNIHTKETLSIVYKRRGQYQAGAMKRINHILRDWRQERPTRMDPKLIDLVWEIHTELGSREPVHVISGYRSPKTNAMLRRTRGGQARRSQHLLGKAMDVHFPDVPVRRLRYSALIRERGGVGYYPTSATPFVHIDTGRVRHWPRMGRYELALLFPNARTRHRPRRGGPITAKDVRVARRTQRETARRVAAFHQSRRNGQSQTVVAAAAPKLIGPFKTLVRAAPPPPQPTLAAVPPSLVGRPRLVDRPSRLVPGPSDADRSALRRLTAYASTPPAEPQRQALGRPAQPQALTGDRQLRPTKLPVADPGVSWVRAPEFDEEHPEELSYRPFPIVPFLTTTASADDPALAKLVHPDAARTLELLDDEGTVPPLRLRPGRQMAQMLWAQAFSGKAVALDSLFAKPPQSRFARKRRKPLARRTVLTTR